MTQIGTENLFLLEFLVDEVNLEKKCDCDSPQGQLCVSFQFLDNGPLEVCENDFSPMRKYGSDDENTKSGKSCLFSLSPQLIEACLTNFDLLVTVTKIMSPDILPNKIDIGLAFISLANLFSELVSSIEATESGGPAAKTMKDIFDLQSDTGKEVGTIGIYIRMSCFGKLIVTQFQMNLQDKSVLFKDKEGKSLYRYRKAGKAGKGSKNGKTCELKMPFSINQKCPDVPCNTTENILSTVIPPDKFNCLGPCANPGQTGYQSPVPNVQMGNYNCPFTPCIMDQSQSPVGVPCVECGTMQTPACGNQGALGMGNVGMASMGMGNRGMGGMGMGGLGMATTMGMGYQGNMMAPCVECDNVPYAPCLQTNGYAQLPNTPCNECAQDYNPPCSQGNYQEIGASMGNNSLVIRVHKDKNKIEAVDENGNAIDDYATTTSNCPCKPGRVEEKGGDGTTIAMRPGVQQGNENQPFSFRMGKCGDGAGNVVVNPPVAIAPDGTQFTEFSDPNKERFILRIGKKSEGVNKKQNLELELCTPKGPDLKPIPKKETRDTQFDENDVPAEEERKIKTPKLSKPEKGKGKKKARK